MTSKQIAPANAGSAAWQALTKALFDHYRPELYYMRGPGPKWHEKNDRVEIDGASRGVRRALMTVFGRDFLRHGSGSIVHVLATASFCMIWPLSAV
jgi:hypothetical protein